jgi:MFS family permease
MHSTDPAPDTVLLWHRVEGAVLSSLAIGAGILFFGPAFGAIAFVGFKHHLQWEIVFAVAGALCVIVGPTYAIIKLARSLREDASLAARNDGVTFERNGKSLHMAWDEIERIELEPPTTLIFRLRAGEPFLLHERFALIETAELAKRLEELRRKASFGLL